MTFSTYDKFRDHFYNLVANLLLFSTQLQQFAMDFQLCWKEVVYLCLIALGKGRICCRPSILTIICHVFDTIIEFEFFFFFRFILSFDHSLPISGWIVDMDRSNMSRSWILGWNRLPLVSYLILQL